jgi:hypothetical protein
LFGWLGNEKHRRVNLAFLKKGVKALSQSITAIKKKRTVQLINGKLIKKCYSKPHANHSQSKNKTSYA